MLISKKSRRSSDDSETRVIDGRSRHVALPICGDDAGAADGGASRLAYARQLLEGDRSAAGSG